MGLPAGHPSPTTRALAPLRMAVTSLVLGALGEHFAGVSDLSRPGCSGDAPCFTGATVRTYRSVSMAGMESVRPLRDSSWSPGPLSAQGAGGLAAAHLVARGRRRDGVSFAPALRGDGAPIGAFGGAREASA